MTNSHWCALARELQVADVAYQDYAMSDLVQEKIMDAEMGMHRTERKVP